MELWRDRGSILRRNIKDRLTVEPPVERVFEAGIKINQCDLYLVLALPKSVSSWVPTAWAPVLVNSLKEGTCRDSGCSSWKNRCIHVQALSKYYAELGDPRVQIGSGEYKPNSAAEILPQYVNIHFGRGVPYQTPQTLVYERAFAIKDKYEATLYPSCVCSHSTTVEGAPPVECKCGYLCDQCNSPWGEDFFSPRCVKLYHDSSVAEVKVQDRKCSSCGNCLRWDGTDEGIFCPTTATAITHKKVYAYLDQIINGGATFRQMHSASMAAYERSCATFMDKVPPSYILCVISTVK